MCPALSDDGGVFTASFFHDVCVTGTAGVTSRFGKVKHQPPGRMLVYLGRCWCVFLYTTSSLPRSPGIRRKRRADLLRAVERLVHIPLRREDRQVRLSALYFRVDVPANYI